MSGPVIQQIISAVGIDVDAEEIDEITSKVFGDGEDGEDGAVSMESLFNQISSGNLDAEGLSGIINSVGGRMGAGEDAESEDNDDIDIEDYDEHIEYIEYNGAD